MIQFAQFCVQLDAAVKQTGLPVENICRQMKGMGYDYLDMSLDEIQSPNMKIISDCGLNVSTLYLFPDYAEDGRKLADRAVEAAIQYHAQFIMPIPSEDHSTPDSLERSLNLNFEELNRLALILKKERIGMILEDFDWGNQIFSCAAGLKRYLDAVPELQVCLDTGNFCSPEDQDTLGVVRQFLDRSPHIHFKDRAADDRWSELKTCPVGAGFLPLKEIADMLKERGFSGVVTAEHACCYDQMSAAAESIRNMRNWFCC